MKLVEIAIVLLATFIILYTCLKGSDLIDQSKVYSNRGKEAVQILRNGDKRR